MNAARYFFVCDLHGPCGSAGVHKSTETARACPVCGNIVEVWIGTDPPKRAEAPNGQRRAG
jgi:hypothetical protein